VTASSIPVLDGHNDLPWALREHCGYDLSAVDLVSGEPALQTDLPRLRAGGVAGQFWSVFVPCELAGDAAVTATLEQIDFVRRCVARYPDRLALAGSAAEVASVVESGRIACLMGVEGGHQINESLGTLRMFGTLGARYLTLTHNENVAWADSATDVPVVGGLTEFGRSVVGELNRIGMFADLSHVSADVMRDALAVTTAPVLFSHSSARAVCDNPRNVPDDVLAQLPSNGGVCQVTFVPRFVAQPISDWYAELYADVEARGSNRHRAADVEPVLEERLRKVPRPACGVSGVADHVDHVRSVAGIDHVGIGGDYDGTTVLPDGMGDVSSYPLLFDELRHRGWSAAELEKLAHGNVLRAMRDMEGCAGS
jgi:membrane dipeptidase